MLDQGCLKFLFGSDSSGGRAACTPARVLGGRAKNRWCRSRLTTVKAWMRLFGFSCHRRLLCSSIRSASHQCSLAPIRNRTTPLSRFNALSATFQFRPRPDTSGNRISEVTPLLYSHVPSKTAKHQHSCVFCFRQSGLRKRRQTSRFRKGRGDGPVFPF